jgi:RNA recognition motif-containing protein
MIALPAVPIAVFALCHSCSRSWRPLRLPAWRGTSLSCGDLGGKIGRRRGRRADGDGVRGDLRDVRFIPFQAQLRVSGYGAHNGSFPTEQVRALVSVSRPDPIDRDHRRSLSRTMKFIDGVRDSLNFKCKTLTKLQRMPAQVQENPSFRRKRWHIK